MLCASATVDPTIEQFTNTDELLTHVEIKHPEKSQDMCTLPNETWAFWRTDGLTYARLEGKIAANTLIKLQANDRAANAIRAPTLPTHTTPKVSIFLSVMVG